VPSSAGKTSSIEYRITGPIAFKAAKTGALLVTQPSSLFATNTSDQAPAANPHRSTPASVRPPPAVSSLEAFRTPASVHPLAPVPGRRPKTLNDSSRSPDRDRAQGSTLPGRLARLVASRSAPVRRPDRSPFTQAKPRFAVAQLGQRGDHGTKIAGMWRMSVSAIQRQGSR
jgi:hypothetical protein